MRILMIEDFAGANGQGFDLSIGEATMALTLVDARPLPANPFPGQLRHPFSLMFRAAGPVILPQRLYKLRNSRIGALDLFLVPIGRDGQGVVYQAIFN